MITALATVEFYAVDRRKEPVLVGVAEKVVLEPAGWARYTNASDFEIVMPKPKKRSAWRMVRLRVWLASGEYVGEVDPYISASHALSEGDRVIIVRGDMTVAPQLLEAPGDVPGASWSRHSADLW